MSRTKRTEEKKFPENPIQAWAYIDTESGAIRVSGLGKDMDPEGKGMQIPFGTKNKAVKDTAVFLPLDQTFMKYYFNSVTRFKARTTEYKSRENDQIAVFENGKYVLRTTPERAPTFDEGKKMSTGMFLYVYHVQSDLCFRLELTALQRSEWFDFQKSQRDKYPTFSLLDMVPPTTEQKEKGAAKHWRYPVFGPAKATDEQNDRADGFSLLLDEYFETHPDFNTEPGEAKESKVDNSRNEADKATEEAIKALPTHDGDEPESEEIQEQAETEEAPNIDDVEDDIFENEDVSKIGVTK